MNVIYTDKAKQSGTGLARLEQATMHLKEIVGASRLTGEVTAEWDRKEGRWPWGSSHYILRLSDWAGKVEADFASGDLQTSRELTSRLRSLWGDLLAVRSHKLVERLIGADGDAGE